jgi:hypothetical protein
MVQGGPALFVFEYSDGAEAVLPIGDQFCPEFTLDGPPALHFDDAGTAVLGRLVERAYGE